ncbi:hypothetical protein BH11BAC5_BH11BAC5_09820 [soil metagenome]
MHRFHCFTLILIIVLSIHAASAQTGRRPVIADSSGFNYAVNAIVVQRDGKMIVGGAFSSYNKLPARGIVRLNGNGSMDTTFLAGNGLDGEVNAIVVQPDGKIIAGGKFTG